MRIPRGVWIGLGVVVVLYAAYAAAATLSNGTTKRVSIVAGVDGSRMFFQCDAANSTEGACVDVDGHAQIRVQKRDRVHVHVASADGKSHMHDFRLQGAPYLVWPAGLEMELEEGAEDGTFTAYATGTYRFICELPGHDEAGMWGTLVVSA